MSHPYTLVLTRGVHLVSAMDAERIFAAVTAGEPLVTVALDPFGDDPDRRTTLAVAHVVALAETPPREPLDATNVAPLRARRTPGATSLRAVAPPRRQ